MLISRTGEVKVADFGLVTAAAQAGASHAGHDPGHRRLPVARAGDHRRGRRPQRRLRGRRAALRAAHRRAAVHRRHGDLGGLPARQRRRAGAVARSPGTCRPSSTTSCVRATRRDPAARPADAARVARRAAPGRRAGSRSRGCRRPCRPARPETRTRARHAATRAAAPRRCPASGRGRRRAGTRDDAAVRRGGAPGHAVGAAAGQLRPGGAAAGCSRVVGRGRRWCSRLLVGGVGLVARQRALDGHAVARRREQASGRAALLAESDLVATVTDARHDDVAAKASSRPADPAAGCRGCCGAAPWR